MKNMSNNISFNNKFYCSPINNNKYPLCNHTSDNKKPNQKCVSVVTIPIEAKITTPIFFKRMIQNYSSGNYDYFYNAKSDMEVEFFNKYFKNFVLQLNNFTRISSNQMEHVFAKNMYDIIMKHYKDSNGKMHELELEMELIIREKKVNK